MKTIKAYEHHDMEFQAAVNQYGEGSKEYAAAATGFSMAISNLGLVLEGQVWVERNKARTFPCHVLWMAT